MRATIHVETGEGINPFSNFTTTSNRTRMRKFQDLLKSFAGGGILSRATSRPTLKYGVQRASGTVTLASVSAADTVTVGAQAFTAVNGGTPATNEFDMSGTNASDATSLVTAINATDNADLTGQVKATNVKGTVVAASVAKNDTVTVDGVTFLAIPSGATLGSLTEFSVGASDAACATNLAAAINAHPMLREKFLATVSSATVTIWQLESLTTVKTYASSNGTRLAVVANAATAVVRVWAVQLGRMGNFIPLASSDGTRLAVSGTALAGGTSTTLTF